MVSHKRKATAKALSPAPLQATAHTRSGRLIKKPTKSGFLDSRLVLNDEGERTSDEDDVETSSSDEDTIRTKRPRKLSVTPDREMHPFVDHDTTAAIATEVDDTRDLIDAEVTTLLERHILSKSSVTIVLNVPSGPERQIVLNVDRSALVERERSPQLTNIKGVQVATTLGRQTLDYLWHRTFPAIANAGLFGRLPSELRRQIYLILFQERNRSINLGNLKWAKLSRCAAFLRTCQLVHEEGTAVLYSNNHFTFERRKTPYGGLWEEHPRELGYIPMRAFLMGISSVNLSLLRNITICLEDALPSLNPLKAPFELRYVVDEVLLSALRHLGRHGRLACLRIVVQGRSILDQWPPNYRFLDTLTRIKADCVLFLANSYYEWRRIHAKRRFTAQLEDMCVRAMRRKQKLYRNPHFALLPREVTRQALESQGVFGLRDVLYKNLPE